MAFLSSATLMKMPRWVWFRHDRERVAALPLSCRRCPLACLAAIFFVVVVDAKVQALAEAARDPLSHSTNDQMLADLDKVYGIKGWDIRPPSFGDSLMQDYGGWRSRLASAGVGLIEFNFT